MDKEQYKKLVKKYQPKENKFQNAITAFLCGGLIGLFANIISKVLESAFSFSQNDSVTIILLLLIFFSSLFTGLGFFDNWVTRYKAGLIIPITGFAHSVTSSALDYKQDGLITGLGSNFFKLAGSVILFGVISGFIFTILRVITWLV